MPKIYKRHCDYCHKYYEGQGRFFCSYSCRMKHSNELDNPAKRPEVKAKLSLAAIGNKRCLGRKLSDKTKKRISKSLKNYVYTDEHRAAISNGVKRAGNIPPKNEHLVGPKHPNWLGGHSTIRQSQFNNPEYKKFHKAVLERDNWTCQDCHNRGGKLCVHHIKAWGPYPELRYNPDNGITLCVSCHYDRHRDTPRPKTKGAYYLADQYPESQDAEVQQ